MIDAMMNFYSPLYYIYCLYFIIIIIIN